jgi:hypothetical protein
MVKFTIVEAGGKSRDIAYLIKELRQKNLIIATEKDAMEETLYLTHNLTAVKKIMEDYDGLILDVQKERK